MKSFSLLGPLQVTSTTLPASDSAGASSVTAAAVILSGRRARTLWPVPLM